MQPLRTIIIGIKPRRIAKKFGAFSSDLGALPKSSAHSHQTSAHCQKVRHIIIRPRRIAKKLGTLSSDLSTLQKSSAHRQKLLPFSYFLLPNFNIFLFI
ncbi:hypothetical protein ACI6PS_07710 [Flavobacterium sp. PLA-1-15]|uniref:hypothetical protein n=1 Tax=Flavobacterium sp. PLA-1-15 TaxID=3380533 RepID=UPI003B7C0938